MRKLLTVLFAIAIGGALTVAIAPGTFLPGIARFLVQDDPLERADIGVVLLGGETPDRVIRAAELYREGMIPKIAFGSGFIDRVIAERSPKELIWVPASARYIIALESLGIPKRDILIIPTPDGLDTAGELEAISAAARNRGWKSVILITSETHSKRASSIWTRVAPDIPFATTPARRGRSLETWWQDPVLVRAIGYEYGAMIKEIFRRVGG